MSVWKLRIKNRKHPTALLALLILLLLSFHAYSQNSLISKLTKGDVDTSADQLEFIGDNIVGHGHVVVRYKDMYMSADKVVCNIATKDLEATGNVKFMRREEIEKVINSDELKEWEDDPNKQVTVQEYFTTPTGRQMLRLNVIEEKISWEGERAIGNLGTGIFNLDTYQGKFENYYMKGESAEREPDASITVKNAELSTCEYLLENHEHYSITASRIRLIPQEGYTELQAKGHDKFEAWAYNCTLRIGGVPVLWVPVLYKPGSGNFGWEVQAGKDYDWGYYVKTRKTFQLWDYPNVTGSLLADWYSRRGFGVGTRIKESSDTTHSEAFIYWISDKNPNLYETRYDIKSNRYELRLNNLSHLAPQMDFRGQIDKLSDINFIEDFFRRRYEVDPQPATFADLEYQFEHFSISGYLRPRINRFFSEVERLPEFRMDVPRQELFKNIHYQGETSLAYMRMLWRHYDKSRESGNKIDPKDYQTWRFDTLHMFYYPFEINWLNLIPRAGMRLTYYSKTSKEKISQKDLDTIFIVDNQSGNEAPGDVVNYNSKGKGKLRLAAELGLETNTKIYGTWNNVKNAFLELDGLRHVMVPYINYNFIPSPTVNRNKIYYFDDIDRINEQNFVRFGVKNRLETRKGDYKKQDIYTWASMENYLDFHFNREKDGYDDPDNDRSLGDFGTILELTPLSDFKIKSELLINAGNFKVDKFKTDFTYQITKRWKTFIRYNYQANYEQRSTYSMGSSLTDITSGSSFARRYNKNNEVSFGLDFPIDQKTRGEFAFDYNIRDKRLEEGRIRLIRTLHCWELAVEYALRQRSNDMGKKINEHNFMIMLYLTAAPSVKIEARQSMGGDQGGDDGG